MLLLNMSPKEGLCNRTKLIHERILNNKFLVCKLTTSDKKLSYQELISSEKLEAMNVNGQDVNS